MKRWQRIFLWTSLLLYCLARCAQLFADKLPTLLIVILHVVPPAAFAFLHGSIRYRVKGMLTFTALCLGVACLFESLSLRTGFPFGHYYFADVMGPKIFALPVLLVLAYLGIGYCSWVLALLILNHSNDRLVGARVVSLPMLASGIMLAWDLSMEADWSTIDRAWIWQNGGSFYGVPITNFLGWYLTAYCFYQLFSFYCRGTQTASPSLPKSYWRVAILFYTVCALGNLLILHLPMAPAVVTDMSGKHWMTMDILTTCAWMSVLVMGPMPLLAWVRLSMLPYRRGVSRQNRRKLNVID